MMDRDSISTEKGYPGGEIARYLSVRKKAGTGEIAGAASDEEFLTEEQLAMSLAEHFQLKYVDLKTYQLGEDVGRLVPMELILRHQAVPYGLDNGRLVIAVADPINVEAVDEIELTSGVPVSLVVASSRDIKNFIQKR